MEICNQGICSGRAGSSPVSSVPSNLWIYWCAKSYAGEYYFNLLSGIASHIEEGTHSFTTWTGSKSSSSGNQESLLSWKDCVWSHKSFILWSSARDLGNKSHAQLYTELHTIFKQLSLVKKICIDHSVLSSLRQRHCLSENWPPRIKRRMSCPHSLILLEAHGSNRRGRIICTRLPQMHVQRAFFWQP